MQDETQDSRKSSPGQVSALPRTTLREQERTEGILVGKLVPGIKSKMVDTHLRSMPFASTRLCGHYPGLSVTDLNQARRRLWVKHQRLLGWQRGSVYPIIVGGRYIEKEGTHGLRESEEQRG